MNSLVDLEKIRRSAALKDWAQECRDRLAKRWSHIDFDSDEWRLGAQYKATMLDVMLAAPLADFVGKDEAYGLVLRCLVATKALEGEVKHSESTVLAWRALARFDIALDDLRHQHFVELEKTWLLASESNLATAPKAIVGLNTLSEQLSELSKRGVIIPLRWRMSVQTKMRLSTLSKEYLRTSKAEKALVLDRQIEALNDAVSAALNGDHRLSTQDVACICVMVILMCAPSRINEPLCLSVDDRFKLEDYAARIDDSKDEALHKVHQLLLIKGSKGAAWGAKPILNFMIELVSRCWDELVKLGERSRTLLEWYETYPDRLYLPPELEHLRGRDLTRSNVWQVMNLSADVEERERTNNLGCASRLFGRLRKSGLTVNVSYESAQRDKLGRVYENRKKIVVPWQTLESFLLKDVSEAMQRCRRVTKGVLYEGKLSKRLMLFDFYDTPYLPGGLTYQTVAEGFMRPGSARLRMGADGKPTSIFEKLDIKMVDKDGVVGYAWISTHDPRRWLTTQGSMARERVSDVLLNKWAQRLNVKSLEHYKLQPAMVRAEQAAMPPIRELEDLSQGLAEIQGLESRIGLNTDTVLVSTTSVRMSSINDIINAGSTRPVARVGHQIMILYAHKFGGCIHQHHETPCRSVKCLGCNKCFVQKGDIPSNDAIRDADAELHAMIVCQISKLLLERERGIADDSEMLDRHILTLVKEQLCPQIMANELLEQFAQIRDGIKDAWFRELLNDAFFTREYAKRLDDPNIRSGAIMMTPNPSRHNAPGHERAIDEQFGGRVQMQTIINDFHCEYPAFAPTSIGVQDQRELLEASYEADDDEEAAA